MTASPYISLFLNFFYEIDTSCGVLLVLFLQTLDLGYFILTEQFAATSPGKSELDCLFFSSEVIGCSKFGTILLNNLSFIC